MRLKDSGISSPIIKRKGFASNTVGRGVSLQGATSKRDSMWHIPVFTCITANRIPVEMYHKPDIQYAPLLVQSIFFVQFQLDVHEQ
jgi:hypothetical protein